MNISLASYESQRLAWPKAGKHILAQYDDASIIVYQAFNPRIAKSILEHQNYHSESCLKSGLNLDRMTWIKTNFLWMMYRSGWASKKCQERILAIRITRNGFEEILSKAVVSTRAKDESGQDLSKSPTKDDLVRLQWDPDHLPNGEKVSSGRRAIQLGLRGDMFIKFSKEFILNISDITEFVKEQSTNVSNTANLVIPQETVYAVLNQEIASQICLSSLD